MYTSHYKWPGAFLSSSKKWNLDDRSRAHWSRSCPLNLHWWNFDATMLRSYYGSMHPRCQWQEVKSAFVVYAECVVLTLVDCRRERLRVVLIVRRRRAEACRLTQVAGECGVSIPSLPLNSGICPEDICFRWVRISLSLSPILSNISFSPPAALSVFRCA